MNWQDKTGWYIYLFFLTFYTFNKALYLMDPDSSISLYYQMLFYFDPVYFIPFALNCLHHVFNVVLIYGVFLFINNRHVIHRNIWKTFFLLKLIVDCVGQNYDYNHIASYFQMETYLGWIALFFYSAMYLPGYVALWIYAWSKEPKPQ